MNWLVFDQSQIVSAQPPRICISGEQAEHLLRVLKVVPGSVLKIGELGGMSGTGTVLEVGNDNVLIEYDLNDEPRPPTATTVILAMPRPQILKKVLQTAAAMQVRRLFLIGAARVEKSYFNSPVAASKGMARYLRLGLEQAMCTLTPIVTVHERFAEFLAGEMEKAVSSSAERMLAHPGAQRQLCHFGLEKTLGDRELVVAIGPEGGWIASEVKEFCERGFSVFGLGPRILRVEIALASVLGQVELLRDLSSGDKRHIESKV